MQKHQQKPIEHVIDQAIEAMAEEQVRFLRKNYRMTAADIINLYTGIYNKTARYEDAVRAIVEHRASAVILQAHTSNLGEL